MTFEPVCPIHGPRRELVLTSVLVGSKVYACDECERVETQALFDAALDELAEWRRERDA